MDDLKHTYREGEDTAKETWRKADGKEDLSDKIGNLGDDIRKDLGDAGDKMDDDDKTPDADTNPGVDDTQTRW
jgi:hypothetical protein